MAYAQGRTFYDADSHIMELPDFLTEYADPDMRDEIPAISVASGGRLAEALKTSVTSKAHPPGRVAELVALGDQITTGPKGYLALGAFNPEERSQALDQLGFHKQLVFSTFAAAVAFNPRKGADVQYAAARAHNRAMGAFCANDKRLMGVAALPLDEPELAVKEVEHLVSQGLKAAWVPHRPCGGRSPGHNDLDPVWAALAKARIPFVLHVGGNSLQIDKAWMNTGRPVATDWLGGGENIRGKDMTGLHHPAETFIGCLVLDGVFDRHPDLRGAVVELGAGWVPQMIERLDWVVKNWAKSDPALASLKRKPSEQIIDHMAFTPFVYEDVGEFIRRSDPRLYLFSSDYPHTEGGRNPLARFEASLEAHDEAAKESFYSGNFARVFDVA